MAKRQKRKVKAKKKPVRPRSPMPPPTKMMDKDKYDRTDERREAEEEIREESSE